jgi:hypothetical protein
MLRNASGTDDTGFSSFRPNNFHTLLWIRILAPDSWDPWILNFFFLMLDVFFWGLKTSPVAWTSFMDAQMS